MLFLEPKRPFFVLLLLAGMLACRSRSTESSLLNRSQNPQEKVSVKHARHFSIQQYANFSLLSLRKPFTDSPDSLQVLLVPHDKPVPEGYEKASLVRVPVRRVVVLSHTQLAFLQVLGKEESVVGINESAYLPDTVFLQKIRAGAVKDVSNAQGVLNLESILALKPDLVVFSGLSAESFRQNQALASAGIPLLINSEWLETSPLGRAEWIKMMALFFEPAVLQKAIKHFGEVEKNYLALQEKTKMARPRPKVLWQVPYKDTWYVPGGESYVARLLLDAGGDYLWKNEKGTASLPFDFETVYARRNEADFWISLGIVRSKKELLDIDARFADFKPFANGQLYNDHRQANPQGGNPYWMQGIVYPDKVLADLIKILHPGLLPKHAWVFFQKVE